MNILILSDVYPPYRGGLEKMTQVLAQGLASRGHSVAVVTSRDGEPLPGSEMEGDVSVHRLPIRSSLSNDDVSAILRNLREMAAIKRSFRPDVVHVQSEAVGSFFHLRTLAAWPCATVLTLHGEVRPMQAAPGTLLGSLLENASCISAVSSASLSTLRMSVPSTEAKSRLIYNAVPSLPNSECCANHSEESEPVVFACGRFSSEKGFDVLLHAFQLLLTDMPEARLVLAGEGPDRNALREMAAGLGIADQVEFPGWLTGDRLTARMCQAAVQVVPSLWLEAFGLVALEGAMLGLPVISTCVGGLPEVVEDGVTGVLVPPRDAPAMRDAMLQLLRSPRLRRQMGEAGRQRSARFDLQHMLDSYEAMYHDALQPSVTALHACATA